MRGSHWRGELNTPHRLHRGLRSRILVIVHMELRLNWVFGWGCVQCQHPQYTQNIKNLMQAGAMLQKRKVTRSRAAVCLDAGSSQGSQASLGEANTV